MSAVARDQSMSPSAVSQQLAQLERETKVSLLKNAGRGVALTDAGVQLARRAHEMLALAETAQAELSASRGETAGRSEERRVGKEGGGRCARCQRPEKEKNRSS